MKKYVFLVACLLAVRCSMEMPTFAEGTGDETETGVKTMAIVGSAHDRHNVPVCCARVILHSQEHNMKKAGLGKRMPDTVRREERTDCDGEFRFDSVEIAPYWIEISFADSIGALVTAQPDSLDTILSVEAIVRPMGRVRGTVDTALTQGASDAGIYVVEIDRRLDIDGTGAVPTAKLPPCDSAYTLRLMEGDSAVNSPLDTLALLVQPAGVYRIDVSPAAATANRGDYSTDSLIVRAILDSNGLDTVTVDRVTGILTGRITKLDLAGRGITALPTQVGELTALQELYLGGNALSVLPTTIGNLTQLRKLWVQENRLTGLPESIGELTNLVELSLSSNRLSDLPISILNLSGLGVYAVRLESNMLCDLPTEIGRWADQHDPGWYTTQQCSFLPADSLVVRGILDSAGHSDMRVSEVVELSGGRVVSLDLYSLSLAVLRDEIGSLRYLEKLTLTGNSLSGLPVALTACANLRELYLSYNRLSVLPDSIGALRNLEKLDVSHNQLAVLPMTFGELTNLTSLWLADNRLADLPASVESLTRVEQLDLADNRLCSLSGAARTWADAADPDWEASQTCGVTDTIIVVAPNGGERFGVGSTLHITWDADTNWVSSVGIDFSSNDGKSWVSLSQNSIGTNDAAWGDFAWVIPETLDGTPTVSDACRIRVFDYFDIAVTDISDSAFTIAQP